MKTPQERFEENYAAVEKPANNKDGFKIEYVYYAPWYLWDKPETELKKCKRVLLGVSVLGLACCLFAGAQRCEANTALWVGVPALLGLCAHVLELYGLIMFNCAKYRTTKMTYTDVNRLLTLALPMRIGMMVLTTAAVAYYLVCSGFSAEGIPALCGFLSSCATAIYIYRTYRALPLRTERNYTLEELEAQGRLH